jgi:molybdopterin converting factor small subunit
MRLQVMLFGQLRTCAPGSAVEVEVADGARVGDAREALAALLAQASPSARTLVARSVLATDDEVLADDARLPADARTLALLPPVCGG